MCSVAGGTEYLAVLRLSSLVVVSCDQPQTVLISGPCHRPSQSPPPPTQYNASEPAGASVTSGSSLSASPD